MVATAKMIFTQAPGGARTAGHAVDDGAVGNAVTVTNEDDTDVQSWSLELFDVPTGPEADCTSALTPAVFASGTAPPVTGSFTPDKFDGYAVRLTVNGTIVDEAVFGCPNELGWFKPPWHSTDDNSEYNGQTRGWAYLQNKIHAAVRAAAADSDLHNYLARKVFL